MKKLKSKVDLLRLTVAFAIASLSAVAADFSTTWVGPLFSEWDVATNWSGGVIPRNTATEHYSVTVNQLPSFDFTQIDLNTDHEVSNLDLTGNLFVGVTSPAEFRVRDFFQFRAGTLNGNGGVYRIFGGAEFSSAQTKYLATSSLHLYGPVRWTGGNVDFSLYSFMQIHPASVFSIETDGYFGSPVNTSSASTLNEGLIRVSNPAGLNFWYGSVTNSGNIDVDAGKIVFYNTYSGTGGFRVGPTGAAVFRFVTSFDGGAFANLGEVELLGPTTVSADTLLPGKSMIATGIAGPGALTLGQSEWRGGTIDGPGTLIIPTGGALSIYGVGLRTSRGILNSGTINITQDSQPYSTAPVTNTGTLAMTSSSFLRTAAFRNDGKILKDATAGSADLQVESLDNPGLIRVEGGALRIAAPVTGGKIEALPAATISLFGDLSSATIRGGGRAVLSGSVDAAIDPSMSIHSSGIIMPGGSALSVRELGLNGSITFTSPAQIDVASAVTWTSGTLKQARLRSLGTMTFDTPSHGAFLDAASVELSGPSEWQGGPIFITAASSITNFAKCRITAPDPLSISKDGRFENRGDWVFINSVTNVALTMRPAEVLLLGVAMTNPPALVPSTYALHGHISLTTNGLTASNATIHVSSLGASDVAIALNDSTMTIDRAAAVTNATVALANGTLNIPGLSGTLTLQGNGLISGPVTATALTLLSADTNDLRVTGNTSIGSGGNISMTLRQTDNGILAPRLTVSGSLTITGRLDISIQTNSNFFPPARTIVLAESASAITGAFANAPSGSALKTTDGNYQYKVFYGAKSPYGENKLVLIDFGSAFDLWRAARFSATDLLNPQISGPAADPDGNGYGNLSEFTFGFDEASPTTTLNPVAELGYCIITIRVRKGAELYSPTFGVSSDLTGWIDIAPGTESNPLLLHRVFDSLAFTTYIYHYPGVPASLFTRFRVQLPP